MEQAELLDLIRRVLRELPHEFMGMLEAAEGDFMPGSTADAEVREPNVGRRGEPWGDEPSKTAFSIARLAAYAAADHVYTLSTIISPRGATLLGTQVVARAALEASAKAWWLLDPALTSRQRVERSFGLRGRATADAARVVAEMGAPAADIDTARARRAEVLSQAARRGIRVHRNKETREVEGIDVKVPGSAELVAGLLDRVDFGIGTGLFSFLSGVTHADYWAVAQFFEQTDGPDDDRTLVPHLSATLLFQIVFLVVRAFIEAVDRVVAVFDWQTDQWHATATAVLHELAAAAPRG